MAVGIGRREFVAALGGGAVAWPLAARAQQPAMPVIGYLGVSPLVSRPWTDAFVQRLRELGWVDSKVAIEYRWWEGRNERMAEFVAEFVRLKVDVLVTAATPPALAAKQATSTIPIVFIAAGDALGSGLVSSLARPGANITGLSNQTKDLAGKRVVLLREIVPDLRRLAILINVGNPVAMLEMDEVRAAASTLGVEITPSEIRRAEDITPALRGA